MFFFDIKDDLLFVPLCNRKSMLERFKCLYGWLAIAVWVPYASAQSDFKLYRPGLLEMRSNFEYVNASENFESTGSRTTLPNGNGITAYNFGLGGRWVQGRSWGIFADAHFNSVESTSEVPTNSSDGTTGTVTRTNSELTDFVLGTDYAAWNTFAEIIPELQLKIPMTSIDENTDQVIGSDGDMSIQARLLLNKRTSSLRYFASAGFKYRDKNYSMQIPWNAGAEASFDSIRLGASLKGQTPLQSQEGSTLADTRENTLRRVNGKSFLYGAIAPYSISTTAWGGYVFDSSSLRGGIAFPIVGSNASASMSVFLEYVYRFSSGTTASSSYDLQVESPTEPEGGFQESTNDGVDQSLFQNSVPAFEEEKVKKGPPIEVQLKKRKPVKKKKKRRR
ncbi:MAG: hypothetical protein AB7O96_05215 [Pseudobdellovibrionaceae bacterium]